LKPVLSAFLQRLSSLPKLRRGLFLSEPFLCLTDQSCDEAAEEMKSSEAALDFAIGDASTPRPLNQPGNMHICVEEIVPCTETVHKEAVLAYPLCPPLIDPSARVHRHVA